jgi:hypothetical protein
LRLCHFHLPVEIRPFAAMFELTFILGMNCVMTWRTASSTSITAHCKGLPILGLGIVDKHRPCAFLVGFSSCGSRCSFYQKLVNPLKLSRQVHYPTLPGCKRALGWNLQNPKPANRLTSVFIDPCSQYLNRLERWRLEKLALTIGRARRCRSLTKEHSVSYTSSLCALGHQDSRIHSVHLCCVWARASQAWSLEQWLMTRRET